MTAASSTVMSPAAASLDRRTRMLRTAMGPLIAAALDDPDVVEVMLNPDGALWLDRLSGGRCRLGTLSAADGERIIRLVAAHIGAEVHRGKPLLSAELPETGERFEGVLVLEDTVELQCPARDHVALRTRPGVVCMADLVRTTLRLRPDRVVVGEVRGGEALDLVKAWGTGHPGGIATIHAGSTQGALLRLEQLILEVALAAPRALIAEAVNLVVFLAGRGRTRHVQQIARVVGHDECGYRLQPIDTLDSNPSLPTASGDQP